MKILYGITKSEPFGGAQRYVYELAQEAKKQRHDVVVLCGQEGGLVERLRERDIRVITLRSLKRDISLVEELRSLIEIVRILRKEGPDVFHINSSKMGGLGALAGRLVGVKKIIFTAHGWAFNEPRPLWQKVIIKFFVWLTILLSHKTICVSEKTRRDIIKWPLVKKKLIIIKNGIKEFHLDQRESKLFTVGTITELHRIKGLDILLIAWSKFRKNHDGMLVIMGDGEERKNLENMAQTLGISGSVVFKGFIEDACTQLLNFDVFCMPSRSEAMPYTLLEAGLAGIPSIATNVGGIPEIIENGISGILIPTEDAEVLFSSLVLLAEDDGLRKRLGAHLKASIQESFSFEKMIENTLSLYL